MTNKMKLAQLVDVASKERVILYYDNERVFDGTASLMPYKWATKYVYQIELCDDNEGNVAMVIELTE